MDRAYYSDTIGGFLASSTDHIIGRIATKSSFGIEFTQRDAWIAQIDILRITLPGFPVQGKLYFEFNVPRLGKRIDVVAIIDNVVFVLEFKIGYQDFLPQAIDQVADYALDLKHFHEASHTLYISPILIATAAQRNGTIAAVSAHQDRLLQPITSASSDLAEVMRKVLAFAKSEAIDVSEWERGRYCPTPTIIEAATALYGGHKVADISRSDAAAINLTETSSAVSELIQQAKSKSQKIVCFVTGVPGAGKTLVGLNLATQHIDCNSDLYSVFLSGNGPLVVVLREALARDKVQREADRGQKIKKGQARSEVKAFIQNVHHFRDECLIDSARPPVEHVALFDEAQRAWNLEQTVKFMRQKKNQPGFQQSEPEFLISCLDRHPDWAAIVCLVGGGQEINTGEAGIKEWIDSLARSFPHWHLYISSRLTDSEYGAGQIIEQAKANPKVTFKNELHLGVSMRSFRSENVSLFVKQVLDMEESTAFQTLRGINTQYPIMLTRCLRKAKAWLRTQARGSERYGIVVSSQAQRLKPHAIDVKSPMDPIHWFLDGKADIRSSYFLEDVATEFHVQGLELDWACVTWDADFRYTKRGWEHWSFCGDRWNQIRKPDRQTYQKNAYRVLLTRARQGMVIVVPEGDPHDHTRQSKFYDPTYEYLAGIGLELL